MQLECKSAYGSSHGVPVPVERLLSEHTVHVYITGKQASGAAGHIRGRGWPSAGKVWVDR